MTIVRNFLFTVMISSILNVACQPTDGSILNYANSATTLEAIKEKTCVRYLKVGDCLLRLQGYEADSNLMGALIEMQPKDLNILKEYGSDLSNQGDPLVVATLKAADTYKLTRPELVALMSYTGPSYYDMNKVLRGNIEHWDQYKHLIYGAASALTHLKSLVVNTNVYRSEGVNAAKGFSLQEIYKPGNILFEATFLSTSTNEKLRFAESDTFESEIVLRYTISSKSGIAIRQFSASPNEDEVLFTPGSVFRVLSFSKGREDIKVGTNMTKVANVEVFNIGLEEIEQMP